MSKLPSLKPEGVEKILLKNGFFIKRQTGSHRIFYNPEAEKLAVVPFHSKDIPKETLKSIIKQAGLPDEFFLKKKV